MSEGKGFEITSPVAIIIAGVIIAVAIIFVKQAPAAPAEAGGAPVSAASVRPPSANDHIVGSPTAPIVLVEYSDFQCPFCSMIYPTLKKITAESKGQVAWVMRNYPLDSIHPQALPAANAAECLSAQLGNTGFWEFADDDFANQANIGSAFFAAEAQKLGANMQAYNTCVASSKYQSVIDADVAEAQAAGAEGTPYIVVLNTKTNKAAPISGALPYAKIMAVIKSVQ